MLSESSWLGSFVQPLSLTYQKGIPFHIASTFRKGNFLLHGVKQGFGQGEYTETTVEGD